MLSRWLAELDDDDIDWITAPTAEWGLQLARSRQPQLILLDLGASPSSALEVIRSLRESRETYLIPLVALSSVECQRLPGLSMYCRRPIQPPEFLAMLRLLLGRVPGARRRLDSDRHAAC